MRRTRSVLDQKIDQRGVAKYLGVSTRTVRTLIKSALKQARRRLRAKIIKPEVLDGRPFQNVTPSPRLDRAGLPPTHPGTVGARSGLELRVQGSSATASGSDESQRGVAARARVGEALIHL